jgi:1-acyl-sn-glycerol-3-phosphate acyltransferase
LKLPTLPPDVPALEGKQLLRSFGRFFAERSGWRVDELPNVSKAVVLAAPHSSNWDGWVGVCGAMGIGVRINWLGKDTLFRWPFGGLIRAFGGIATDRSSASGVVDQIAQTLAEAERMWLVLAPEGTRKKVKKWRTGFWHIAEKAKVPIIPGYLHYPEKRIGFGSPMMTTGDMQADLQTLYEFYAPFRGKGGKTALPTEFERR